MEIIVCALKCEATPIIKALSKPPFKNIAAKVFVCGAKVKNTKFMEHLNPNDHLINVGICAGKNIGSIYQCNKIKCKTKNDDTIFLKNLNGKRKSEDFYPDLFIPSNISQFTITTIDKLATKNMITRNPYTLYDQESALLYKLASKKLSPHQMSFIKVVFDDGIEQTSKTDKNNSYAFKCDAASKHCLENTSESFVSSKGDAEFSNLQPDILDKKYCKSHKYYAKFSPKNVEKCIESQIENIMEFIKTSDEYFKSTQVNCNTISNMKMAKLLNSLSDDLKCTTSMKSRLKQQLIFAQITNINIWKFFDKLKTSGKIPVEHKKDGIKILNKLDNYIISCEA